jgi:hypothetical protein
MASVMRPRRGPLWVLLAGGATVMAMSGCLWKDDVNQLPQVLISGPAAVHIGETAKFEAKFTNDEPGQMTYEWSRTRSCPKDLAEARQAPDLLERKFGPMITWTIDPKWPAADKAAYCTFVIATDDRGAVGFQKHAVALVDRKVVLTVPAQVTSGMPAKYTATFSDDPAAAATAKFFWGSSADPTDPCKAAEQSAKENLVALLEKPAEWESNAARRPYCVMAIGIDRFGAEYRASTKITNILNGGPPASPRVVLPKEATVVSAKEAVVGIFSHVRLAAAEMGELLPSDLLTFTWTVKRPDGTALPAAGCEGAMPLNSEICFDVADGGAYRVDLKTEEAGQIANGDFTLKVEDRPPCIRLTEPTLTDTGGMTVFSLAGEERVLKVDQVVDDGDPLPPVGRTSEGAFVWTIRTVSGTGEDRTTPFSVLPNAIFERFTLPAGQYRLGDQVEVRVEYRDRLDLRDLKARDVSHCDPLGLSCEDKPKSKCFLRVGWKVMYL